MDKKTLMNIGASIVSIAAVMGIKKGISMMIESRSIGDEDDIIDETRK